VHQLSQTIFQRNFTAVVNIFDQGRQRGEFHSSVDPGAAAMLLCGATQCFFNCREVLREFRASTDLEKPEAYVRRVAALILKGVLRVVGRLHRSRYRRVWRGSRIGPSCRLEMEHVPRWPVGRQHVITPGLHRNPPLRHGIRWQLFAKSTGLKRLE